jgi:regulator of protease activity HflC (stomatin/prohibitin superfamily)
MFMAVIIGILALFTIGAIVAAFIVPKEDEGYHPRRWAIITAAVLLFFTVLATGLSTAKVVGPTEVGVPVSFGNVGEPMQPGLTFVAPWVDVETYPTRPVTVELSGDSTIVARTADAGQMRVEVAARWKVNPQNAKNLYLQVRTGDDDRISQDIVVKNLRQAVGQVYSVTGNLDALNDRTKATRAIYDQLNEQLQPYGIIIEDINLRSVEPDEKTANTIALYASQQQATRIAEEAKKTATIEAQRRLIEAQGLEQSANAVTNIDADSAKILCMQIWQQVVGKGIEAGVPIYTNPCGVDGSVSVLAGTAK